MCSHSEPGRRRCSLRDATRNDQRFFDLFRAVDHILRYAITRVHKNVQNLRKTLTDQKLSFGRCFYGATVQKPEIGRILVVGQLIAGRRQQPAHVLRIAAIVRAAPCSHINTSSAYKCTGFESQRHSCFLSRIKESTPQPQLFLQESSISAIWTATIYGAFSSRKFTELEN